MAGGSAVGALPQYALFVRAIRDDDWETVESCLRDGSVNANDNLVSRDWDGELCYAMPLHLALNTCSTRITRLLLEYGADPNSQRLLLRHIHVYGYTGIGSEKHIECAKLLLQFGANPNMRDPHGRTPLHYVSIYTVKLIDILMSYGADVNSQDDSGHTPLCSILQNNSIYVTVGDNKMDSLLTTYFQYRPNVYLKINDGRPVHTYIRNTYPKRYSVCVEKYMRTWVRWAILRSCVVLLGLHQRATVTANHPTRCLERGEFCVGTSECDEGLEG